MRSEAWRLQSVFRLACPNKLWVGSRCTGSVGDARRKPVRVLPVLHTSRFKTFLLALEKVQCSCRPCSYPNCPRLPPSLGGAGALSRFSASPPLWAPFSRYARTDVEPMGSGPSCSTIWCVDLGRPMCLKATPHLVPPCQKKPMMGFYKGSCRKVPVIWSCKSFCCVFFVLPLHPTHPAGPTLFAPSVADLIEIILTFRLTTMGFKNVDASCAMV